jgi:hypothetical protein
MTSAAALMCRKCAIQRGPRSGWWSSGRGPPRNSKAAAIPLGKAEPVSRRPSRGMAATIPHTRMPSTTHPGASFTGRWSTTGQAVPDSRKGSRTKAHLFLFTPTRCHNSRHLASIFVLLKTKGKLEEGKEEVHRRPVAVRRSSPQRTAAGQNRREGRPPRPPSTLRPTLAPTRAPRARSGSCGRTSVCASCLVGPPLCTTKSGGNKGGYLLLFIPDVDPILGECSRQKRAQGAIVTNFPITIHYCGRQRWPGSRPDALQCAAGSPLQAVGCPCEGPRGG